VGRIVREGYCVGLGLGSWILRVGNRWIPRLLGNVVRFLVDRHYERVEHRT